MRIFQVLSNTTNSNLPHNNTWYRNLYEPLIEMGHDVFLYDSNKKRKRKRRRKQKSLNLLGNL